MKNTFELLYDNLLSESNALKQLEKQREKFVTALSAMKYLRKTFTTQLKDLKITMKKATGAEYAALVEARKSIIQNNEAIFENILELKYRLMMMDKNLPVLRQLVEDLGRESKKHCPEDWVPPKKLQKAPLLDDVKDRIAYIEGVKNGKTESKAAE